MSARATRSGSQSSGGKTALSCATKSDSDSPKQSCCKLFIGGLSYDTTDESLQEYFEKYGPVESAVVLRDPTSLRSRGFGFVTFADIASATKVVEATRHLIDGRKVEAKFAVPRASTPTNAATSPATSLTSPRSIASSGSGNNRRKTKSRGNSFASTSSTTPRSGVSAGSGESVAMPYSAAVSSTGKVNFASTVSGSSHRHLSLDLSVSGESSVRSDSLASSIRSEEDSLFEDLPGRQSFDSTMSSDKVRNDSTCSSSNSNGKKRNAGAGGAIISNKIFVGGLLYATGHESLRLFFERYGVVDTAEVIYNRDTKKSRGFGFVIFREHESVLKVLEDQDAECHVIDGKQVEVKKCFSRQESSNSLKSPSRSGHQQQQPQQQPQLQSPRGSDPVIQEGDHVLPWATPTQSSPFDFNLNVDHGDAGSFHLDDLLEDESVDYRGERTISSSSVSSFLNYPCSPLPSTSPCDRSFHHSPVHAGSTKPLPALSLDASGFQQSGSSPLRSASPLGSNSIWSPTSRQQQQPVFGFGNLSFDSAPSPSSTTSASSFGYNNYYSAEQHHHQGYHHQQQHYHQHHQQNFFEQPM